MYHVTWTVTYNITSKYIATKQRVNYVRQIMTCHIRRIYKVSFAGCVARLSQIVLSWWHHQGGIFSALLAFCAGNSPVTGEFPSQRPVTRSFDVFFDLRLNWRSSKQSWGWWFQTPSCPLWRHCNGLKYISCCRKKYNRITFDVCMTNTTF